MARPSPAPKRRKAPRKARKAPESPPAAESAQPGSDSGTPSGSPPGTPNGAEHILLADAAELTGLSERTLRRHIKAKRLTAKRDSAGRWLVAEAELEGLKRPPGKARTARPGSPTGTPDNAELTPLLATVLQLNRELSESRQQSERLLTAGDTARVEAERAAVELQTGLVRAELSKRWALLLAAAGWLVALGLALVLGIGSG